MKIVLYVLNKPLKVSGVKGGEAYGMLCKGDTVDECQRIGKSQVKMELTRNTWMDTDCSFTCIWCQMNGKEETDTIWSYTSKDGVEYRTDGRMFPKEFFNDLKIKDACYSIIEVKSEHLPLVSDFESVDGFIYLTNKRCWISYKGNIEYENWMEVDDECEYLDIKKLDNIMTPAFSNSTSIFK